jgi:hypothetical protein
MNDFVINVRQIMEYPLKGEASSADAVLLQTGALGGPYAYTTAYGLVVGALDWPGSQLGVGIPLPGNAVDSGLLATNVGVPVGGAFWFNVYQTAVGPAYLGPGPGAVFTFDGTAGTLQWEIFDGIGPMPVGRPNGGQLQLTLAGELWLPYNTLTVARDPIDPLEVATKNYVDGEITALDSDLTSFINSQINAVNNRIDGLQALYNTATVWSFNGRTGNVALQLADVTGVGGAPIFSPGFTGSPTVPTPPLGDTSLLVPNTAWVDVAITNAIDYVVNNSIVSSFNGRTGNVTLTQNDILSAGGAPIDSPDFIGSPLAPTPAQSSNSDRIATTAFVQSAISTLAGDIETIIERRVTISKTPPPDPQESDLWWDSSKLPDGNGQLYIWYVDADSAQWVDASPSQPGPMGPQGESGIALAHIGSSPPDDPRNGAMWQETTAGIFRVWDEFEEVWTPTGAQEFRSAPQGVDYAVMLTDRLLFTNVVGNPTWQMPNSDQFGEGATLTVIWATSGGLTFEAAPGQSMLYGRGLGTVATTQALQTPAGTGVWKFISAPWGWWLDLPAVFNSNVNGLVPAPGAAAANAVLHADGTWY